MANVTRVSFSCYPGWGSLSAPVTVGDFIGSEVRLTDQFPNLDYLVPKDEAFEVIFEHSKADLNVTNVDIIQTMVENRSDVDLWYFGMSSERYKLVDYLMSVRVRQDQLLLGLSNCKAIMHG